jgi:hypothetical protein
MRTRSQQVPRDFQRGQRLFPGYRRKVVEKTLERIAGGQVIDEVLDGDARSRKDRVPPSTSGSHRTTNSKVGMAIATRMDPMIALRAE